MWNSVHGDWQAGLHLNLFLPPLTQGQKLVHTCVSVCLHARAYTNTDLRTFVRTHRYTHIHTHTQIHTFSLSPYAHTSTCVCRHRSDTQSHCQVYAKCKYCSSVILPLLGLTVCVCVCVLLLVPVQKKREFFFSFVIGFRLFVVCIHDSVGISTPTRHLCLCFRVGVSRGNSEAHSRQTSVLEEARLLGTFPWLLLLELGE